MLGLSPFQRFVGLSGSFLFAAPINFCHQKDFFPITVPQSLSHSDFTLSVTVVPAIVHECDSPVDRAPEQMNTIVFIGLFPNVIASQSNQGNPLPGSAQAPKYHVASSLLFRLVVG